MAHDNMVTIIGNLGQDPELRYTSSGLACANLSIAYNRKWTKKGDSEATEETHWFRVTAWGDLAEHVCDSLVKGARVLVVGRLDYREWENDAGEKRNAVQIVADEVTPSLRWATAEVTKTESKGGGGGRAPRGDDVPPIGDEEPF